MANSVFRPTQPHFFQPILPNFHTQLKIPEVFFVRYLEEKKPRSAVLKSDGGERSWLVKINGRRITDGWKEFAGSHDLHVGDIVMFRFDGRRMVFHVTVFGPSGCEKPNAPFCGIKQEHALSTEESQEEESQEDEILEEETQEEETSQDSKKKRAKRRSKARDADFDESSFVATVTPSSLRDNTMYFLKKFAQLSGLDKTSGMICLMNKRERMWKSCLAKKPNGIVYIRGVWRDFCAENNLKVGDLYGFKLSWKAEIPMITLMDSDELLEASGKFLKTNDGAVHSRQRVSCSASQDLPFLTLRVTANAFSKGMQYVPKQFARANGLNHGHDEITVMDKDGLCSVINLWCEKSSGKVFLGSGWKSFCVANAIEKATPSGWSWFLGRS